MYNDLVIECVFPRTPKEFNRFIRSKEMQNTKVVNYISIKNKLAKSDPYNKVPNDSIIGLAITNDISRSLRSEKKHINKIIYLLRSLEPETISNFKDMISDQTERTFEINLTMLYSTKQIPLEVQDLFDTIKYIEDDQA